jgi:hypothetical protein
MSEEIRVTVEGENKTAPVEHPAPADNTDIEQARRNHAMVATAHNEVLQTKREAMAAAP